jgi:hypothetical protein
MSLNADLIDACVKAKPLTNGGEIDRPAAIILISVHQR